jgi:phosphoglycerol transferase MdoB-like AlkP superfamily enzyme
MLIVLQVIATALLWVLNPIDQAQTDAFALFLSVDLISFAMLSYQYRVRRHEQTPNPAWTAIGYLALIALLVGVLVLR